MAMLLLRTAGQLRAMHGGPQAAAAFEKLGVPSAICERLSACGIATPTAVQSLAIPPILARKNVLVESETGSGKTLAYLVPLLAKKPTPRSKAIIAVPTRELAVQTFAELKKIADETTSAHVVVSGGDEEQQLSRLKNDAAASVIIGTPRRLFELVELFRTSTRYIVVDEFDKVIDPLGPHSSEASKKSRLKHPKDITSLLDALYFDGRGRTYSDRPEPVRPLEFIGLSASVSGPARRELYVHGWCRKPEFLSTSAGHTPVPAAIKHSHIPCKEDEILPNLESLLRNLPVTSAFVFVPPSVRMATVMDLLRSVGLTARSVCDHVNGVSVTDMMGKRAELVDWLRSGTLGEPAIAVAGTHAIRGLDLRGVSHAFLVGVAENALEYLHVCGRVGRLGEAGHMITLTSSEVEEKKHFKILNALGVKVSTVNVPQLVEGTV